MVSEKQLLKTLATEERAAKLRLKVVRQRQKNLQLQLAEKQRVADLKKKISAARAKGKRPLLTKTDKVILRKKGKAVLKQVGFVTDVIAFGYSAAKGKKRKKGGGRLF